MRTMKSFRRPVRISIASAAACLVAAGLALAAPGVLADLTGDWQGAISTGSASLRVVVHVTLDKDGRLAGTMDSPDQGATGIVFSSISWAAPELSFSIDKLGAGYQGKLDAKTGRIDGTWKQGSASLPLALSRVKP